MVNHFQQFYRNSAGSQLGLVLRQVDHLSNLVSQCLECDVVGVFYRPSASGDLVGLGFSQRSSGAQHDLAKLEALIGIWPEEAGDDWFDITSGHPQLDQFAGTSLLSKGLHRVWTSEEAGQMHLLAFASDSSVALSGMASKQLNLVAGAILESLNLARQIQSMGDFSRRLGQLLKMYDTHLVDTRFETTLTMMLKQLQAAVPSSGAAIVGYDRHTRDYGVLQHEGRLPSDKFPTCLAGSVGRIMAAADQQAAPSMPEACGRQESIDETLVLIEALPADEGQSIAFAVWRDEDDVFSSDDTELVHLFSVMAAPLLCNAGSVRHLVVSHRKMQESSSRLAEAEALAALTDMTSGVAHDLNNVMGGIIGRLQLMRVRCQDSKLNQDLERLEKMALEGAQTIASIQEFSSSAAYMQPEPVDLRLVVDQCLNAPNSDWKAKAEGRAVSVRLQTDVESAVVEGNADKLVVALEHLLENAVEHSPDGGQVLVMLEAQADEYRLAVVDHGPGIPKAIQGKIFYPFFSTKQRVRSSGLGLAVVHGTVVRHGGTVAIDPDWESGTRMVITFRRPLGLKEDSDITRRGQRRSGLYVLVVDDDEQIREILCDMLTIEGHNPIACADGYAALEAANSGHFDIMITDLGMPGMSGLDLAGLINESFPEIAVAMITGWGSQLDHGEVAIKGIRQVLAKPFHLRDVKDMVRKLVAV